MRRPEKPGGATHWCNEAGYYCKADGGFVWWWRSNPQTHKREWHQTEIPSSDLDWNFMYDELNPT